MKILYWQMANLFKRFISGGKISKPGSNEIPLWPDGVEGSRGKPDKEKIKVIGGEKIISGIHHPSVIAYLPSSENAKGAAVIIAPGGSHKELWIDHEGHNPAQWFCNHGIAVFVLKYRLAKEVHSTYTINGHALSDMQRAIRFVRSHAAEWGINTARIGVMGFSAGGEIAALAAMHFDDGNKKDNDKILQQSSYPNFQALIYPAGTDHFKASKFSPPLFLLCGNNDDEISRGVAETYLMYKEAGIPAELHIYANEGHGFGVRENNHAAIAKWPERFVDWLSESGFIRK